MKFLRRKRDGERQTRVSLIAKSLFFALAVPFFAAAQDSYILPKEAEWKPVTSEQRWKIYRDKTYSSPGAYFRSFGAAAGDQLNKQPPSWPQGLEGYSRRVGQRFVTFTLQDSAEAALSGAIGYEPRYVRCKCEGAGRRLGHAIQMNFLTFDHNGKKVVHWPKFAGAYGAGLLSTTWVKDYKWSAQGIQAGNSQIYFGVVLNIVREFSPELKRVFKRK